MRPLVLLLGLLLSVSAVLSVTRVSRALAVAQTAPGGVFRYYVQYCF